jgi:hypothetical protein
MSELQSVEVIPPPELDVFLAKSALGLNPENQNIPQAIERDPVSYLFNQFSV